MRRRCRTDLSAPPVARSPPSMHGRSTAALTGTFPFSIDATAGIAGFYLDTSGTLHGFKRAAADGTITTFDVPGGGTGSMQGGGGLSISATGVIAGSYFDANSVLHGFVLAPAQVTVTVTPSSSSITTAQALTVTVAVSGGSGNPAPTGSVTLTSSGYTSAATPLNSGSATINIASNSLAPGTDTLTASYSGDANYGASTGTGSVTVTVPPGFAVGGPGVIVNRGATTGNTSTISVTPSGGFTGSVALTASVTSSPANAQNPPTLSFGSTTPVNIAGAAAGTATLTISTTAATTGTLAYPLRRPVGWYTAGGAAMACLLLFGIPSRRRSWRTMFGLLVFCVLLAGGVVACGSSGKNTSSSGGAGTSNPGTTPGTYTVTVVGTSGALSSQGTVIVTVQ